MAVDTTQATASNRIKLYVNGAQITAFSTATYAAQNSSPYMNSAVAHSLASWQPFTSGLYFDGYLAEVNFIDGQALTPSSFGAYDSNGVWQPARYTGSYTGNSFYLPFSATATSSFAGSFNGSTQYLTTATNAGLGLGTSDFTIEYWMNTTVIVNGSGTVTAGPGTGLYDGLFGYIAGTAFVTYLSSTGGGWDIANGRTVISTITAGRWYHIAFTRSGSTWRSFVDGTQVDTFTSSASLYQSANQFALARVQGTNPFNGLLSNVRVIKGTALYTSNFTPPTSPLTAVTNTQLLTLQSATVVDNSANALTITNTGSVTTSTATPWNNYVVGQDSSGRGNNWVLNNINTASSGTTYDLMIDSPINATGDIGNYCVFNFLDKFSSTVLSNGNLSTNGVGVARSTFGMTSGKWYWEFTPQSTACMFGIATAAANTAQYVGQNAFGWAYYGANGNKYNNASPVAYGATFTTNDVIGVAFDADIGTLTFYKNGTSQGTAFTGLTSGPYFAASGDNGGTAQPTAINFGQRPFTYTAPSGFLALNTQNLTTPTILNGAQYMAAVTYQGATAPNTVTTSSTNSGNNPLGTTFQPDLVWIKSRSAATDHKLTDAVRGTTKALVSTSTAAETTDTNGLTAFTASGFTVGSDTIYNNTTGPATYVAWQWKGGNGTSNIAVNAYGSTPSIASTVSANVAAGFSVVAYTGITGSATVGHGLGVTPSLIIAKCRTAGAGFNWPVWHMGLTSASYFLRFNTADAQILASSIWGTAPNSSVFTIGTDPAINSATTYIAYCFAPVAGYSAFGKYTGNGSTDGPFVYLGFRPRFVMTKRIDTTSPWQIIDTSRDTYNSSVAGLFPNTSGAEASFTQPNGIDYLSNGFKLRNSSTDDNASGGTYIYAAFAENPFKISRAR
jgi:hypothetical protein